MATYNLLLLPGDGIGPEVMAEVKRLFDFYDHCEARGIAQHRGIGKVEVRVNRGDWKEADLARAISTDTWLQWRLAVPLGPGQYEVQVRATDLAGGFQALMDGFLPHSLRSRDRSVVTVHDLAVLRHPEAFNGWSRWYGPRVVPRVARARPRRAPRGAGSRASGAGSSTRRPRC